MLRVAAMVLTAALGGQESLQLGAVRAMEKALREDPKRFYQDHGHPDFRKDVTVEELEQGMKEAEGKALTALLAAIVRAADAKAGPDVLLPHPQEPEGCYAFILVKVRDKPAAERKGEKWFLNLKADGGAWKFLSVE
jgi:hypothetical protein